MNAYPLLIAALIGAIGLHAQEVAMSGSASVSLKVLDSQEVDLGDRKIIYNLVETPKLKPESVAISPVADAEAAVVPAVLEQHEGWTAKAQESYFFSVTVYDRNFSEVRWWEDRKENVVWSNVNFLHFGSFADVETPRACYSVMLRGWETSTAEARTFNATAQSYLGQMALPPAGLRRLVKVGPQWIAATSVSENAQRVMNDLHEYYRKHGAKLAADYAKAEADAKAHEAWTKANPPVPQDTIINFFPIRSSNLDAVREEAAEQ